MSRNELCACGSGKRYKHCHGRLEGGAIAAEASSAARTGIVSAQPLWDVPRVPSALHREALNAHQSGLLRQAEELYRRAIEADPSDVDSVHMLGVVYFERRRYREALDLLWEAAERTGWNDTALRQNLGLLLAKLITPEANARQEALVTEYSARKLALAAQPVVPGRVSVVLVVRDQASTVAQAIASVAAQTYRDLELIVVEGASTDASAATVAQSLRAIAVPAMQVRSERRGFSHAANLGARHASGRYLAFLEGDDSFAPERIERMIAGIARESPLWGFSQVAYTGTTIQPDSTAASALRPRDFLAHDPVSFTLLARNPIERTGNLFIERGLFNRIGGFLDMAGDQGWDLAIRAAREVEPVAIAGELYLHAGHGPARPQAEVARDRTVERLVLNALTSDEPVRNEFCPQFAQNRIVLLRSELRAGRGDRLPVAMLRTLATEWRGRRFATTRHDEQLAATQGDKVALVVLGMYRSGTSAVARALNLCGAFLPDRVVAARLGINPKGFWETEAVTDLDARFLEHLGADWNRVDFELPTHGPLTDEFVLNVREVLQQEHGAAPLILIKDPRICVLAPLWDRALREGGYRPVYVVVVRHPAEVAGSMETQGDMPLARGLALWHTYMRRAEAFVAEGGVDAVHIRYTELLEDWRRVVGRVARRLSIALDIDKRADEVDRFLEAGMRTHHADDARLDATAPAAQTEAIAALYRRLLERCERDASFGQE